MPQLILNNKIREKLKKPFGKVITGSNERVINTIAEITNRLKPKKIICVGDAVSRLLSKSPIKADVRIIDNREMRAEAQPFNYNAKHLLNLRNPPGTIVEEAWFIVNQALKQDESLVIVDGEEDLLALVVALEAPIGSLLLYGQPHEGVVVVVIDKRLKLKTEELLSLMNRKP